MEWDTNRFFLFVSRTARTLTKIWQKTLSRSHSRNNSTVILHVKNAQECPYLFLYLNIYVFCFVNTYSLINIHCCHFGPIARNPSQWNELMNSVLQVQVHREHLGRANQPNATTSVKKTSSAKTSQWQQQQQQQQQGKDNRSLLAHKSYKIESWKFPECWSNKFITPPCHSNLTLNNYCSIPTVTVDIFRGYGTQQQHSTAQRTAMDIQI